jgi:hypothetical protein
MSEQNEHSEMAKKILTHIDRIKIIVVNADTVLRTATYEINELKELLKRLEPPEDERHDNR